MKDVRPILRDLADEQQDLLSLIAPLDDAQWQLQTPAPGWTIAHQIAHLAYFDEAAAISIMDPQAFARIRAEADEDPFGFGEAVLVPLIALGATELMTRWKSCAQAFQSAASAADPSKRVDWFGPSMSLASKITARLMETWAHGQDVADALGVRREPTARLRHIALIAYKARPYSYLVRDLPVPEQEIFVELTSPTGESWRFGSPTATERITGSAEDFCLVLTRRRHVADSKLVATGEAATEWLSIGQAFAGDPGAGRSPGQFP
ncbi:MAG: TIGR03084 family protein [Leucobacter sp.]|jgi:uncharacterized protein (TIGR03084 family)|nr:TIGR03084 family protein [Leucobacter sp.]